MVGNESLFHTLLYHNQMYEVYAGNDGIFFYVIKVKVDLNHNFRRFLFGYKDKATRNNNKKLQENSQGLHKDGILLPRGGICHPIATPLCAIQH